jgi:hypothetical protein
VLFGEIQSLVSFLSWRGEVALFVSREPFSVQNGLLTPSLKKKRKALFSEFGCVHFETVPQVQQTDTCEDEVGIVIFVLFVLFILSTTRCL